MSNNINIENQDEHNENFVMATRREKLNEWRSQHKAYPNQFRRENLANECHADYGHASTEELQQKAVRVKVAGRIMLRRIMGKASFVTIQDMSGRIQFYVKSDELPEGIYEEFKKWDMGDIVGAEGVLFKTKTNELSVHVDKIELLSKSLRPLPEKFHGLNDQEMKYRQRYVDLIVTEKTRKTFEMRSKILAVIREMLAKDGFMEVETPMMQPLAGGAAAKPFVTHHNALDMQLFLRVAPELYLKRLIVGGFEKVFEINRNFRNEGVSARHNPEFTMLELYQAYADYKDVLILTERIIRETAQKVLGTTHVVYGDTAYDLSKPFKVMTVLESIIAYNYNITMDDLNDLAKARKIAESLKIKVDNATGLGKVQIQIFEETVEHKLFEPTFITEYPIEVSPLSRRNDINPFIADRFEFFLCGRELANAFSELNDPEDQAQRFKEQMKNKVAGDDEAMPYDEDYIMALEYGMPPTAGLGIGIDRLVMFLTDSPSIRDVILFPHMRNK